MSERWPAEWEDGDDVFPGGADQTAAEAGARQAEVAAYLASSPAPALPDHVEARISAALAAEAASRSAGSGRPRSDGVDSLDAAGLRGEPAGPRTLEAAPARARVRRRRRRPSLRRRVLVIGPLVACLLFAGLGYALSRGGTPGTSTSGSVAAPVAEPSEAAEGAAGSSAGSASSPAGAGAAEPGPMAPENPEASPAFDVIHSGTAYRHATLAGQVKGTLAAQETTTSPTGRAPGAPSAPPHSGGTAASPPTPQLVGCAAHLTGGGAPRLVDQATYQGAPAYVIVGSTQVWVVGLGCTAANPELIASVALAG